MCLIRRVLCLENDAYRSVITGDEFDAGQGQGFGHLVERGATAVGQCLFHPLRPCVCERRSPEVLLVHNTQPLAQGHGVHVHLGQFLRLCVFVCVPVYVLVHWPAP